MLKETRLQGEKNKIRAVFKLQFHATQANNLGWEVMMVSLVPLDIGKATMKTDKVLVIGGICYWRNPIYETVKLYQDTRTGKLHDKLYNFVVSANGSTTAAIVGEITINLSDYIEVVKPTSVALPLRPSKSGVILHVTIQRMHADLEVRESEEPKDTIFMEQWTNNNHESDKWDEERRTVQRKVKSTKHGSSSTSSERKRFPSKRTVYLHPESSGSLEKSSSSNTSTTAGSDSSGQYTPRENRSLSQNGHEDSSASKSLLNNDGTLKEEKTILDYLIMECSDHQKSTNSWFVSSAPDGTMVNSMKSSIEGGPGKSKQDTNAQIEKYGGHALQQTEHLDLSELEMRNLVTMESNRGETLLRKLNSLKGERDALKRECEELKASQRKNDIEDDSNKLQPHTEVSLSFIEEIKQELQYERNLNANLHLQINKTQESNSELILAVQDLEELLEQKNRDITCINCGKSSIKQSTHDDVSEMNFTEGNSHVQISECEELFETTSDGDDEQYHLDVLVKEDIGKVKAVYSVEQKIEDLNNDIDVYRKQQEDLQMKFEKLTLEYEILKQENNDLYSKIEQAQPQEPLNMQHECSEHSITNNDLEEQVRTLNNKLQEQSRAYKDSLEGIMKAKLEQERRATEAEKAQQLMRLNHANIAEKLKEEFETLAGEISSTFHMNEKLAIQALTEANEMHTKKCQLEKQIEKTTEDFEVLQHQHELKLKELSDLVDFKTKENEKLLEKLKTKIEENDNQKKSQEVKLKALSEDIVVLEAQVKRLSEEKIQICEQIVHSKKSAREMEQLKNFNKEIETKLHERSLEREMLNSELASMKEEAVKSRKDIQILQHLVEEKEIIIKNLNSEVESIREGLFEDEMEKETIRKDVFHLQRDLRKKDDTITRLEKKLKESSPRTAKSGASMKTATARNKTNKLGTASQGSMEVIALHEKIELLEEKLTIKDTALEDTKTSFLKKEKDLTNKIEELEKGIHQCKQQEDHDLKHNQEGDSTNSIDIDLQLSTEVIRLEKTEEESISNNCNQDYLGEMLDEMAMLKKNSKAMETELKEMQQRYTEISLRFAEVEGERQQLVMTVRNLRNALKT